MRLNMTAAAMVVGAALAAATVPAFAGDGLKVRAYFGPGYNYFRAAAGSLAESGVKIELEDVKGDWIVEPPLHQKIAAKDVVGGNVVTTAERRLTDAERKAGLDDVVLGYFGAIVLVHPEAPIDSLDAKKWAKVLARPSLDGMKWSDLGTLTAGQADAPIKWSLPNAGFKDWARPLIKLRGMPQVALAKMRKESQLEPEDTTVVAAKDKSSIAVFGYNFVTQHLAHAQLPLKILKYDGIAPTDLTLADGSYKLSAALVAVFSAKAGAEPGSPVAKLVSWIKSEQSGRIATMRALVPAQEQKAPAH